MNYRLFGKSGLRVSEICLGTMTFGAKNEWGADYEESKRIFDAYTKAGGNFIDTANRYAEGNSEWFVGDFTTSDRDHFVIATKYALHDRLGDPNFSGNHRKNLKRSVSESLKRLQTDHIDLLWLHAWDFTVAPDEILRALEDLIRLGDVHHIGISDTPAWIVAQANTIAEIRGWSAFAGLQIEYSLLQRTPERDLLPMAKAFQVAVTPWAPLAGGALTGKYLHSNEEDKRLKPESARLNERAQAITREVVSIAQELNVSPSQVAINWARQKDQIVIPIVGARKAGQMEDCLRAADFVLSEAHILRLNAISAIELGFPHDFLNGDGVKNVAYSGVLDQIKDIKR